MRAPNSAYYAKLQLDHGQLVELIDLEAANYSFHWTTANHRVTASWSGTQTDYDPFPGTTMRGVEESADMGVSVVDFIIANSGEIFGKLTAGSDFAMSKLAVCRVFTDTPDLGRMWIYHGRLGDYSFTRKAVTGQARNMWQGAQLQWPYYTYMDTCVWKFGSPGCGFDTTSITRVVSNGYISIGSSDSLTLTLTPGFLSNSYANGRFDFGRLTVTAGVNSGQVRTIRSHSSDILNLSHPLLINSLAGMQFSIFPGCRKRILEDCTSLYNNAENFQGYPWIPIQETAIV